jgi:hypothetical protein
MAPLCAATLISCAATVYAGTNDQAGFAASFAKPETNGSTKTAPEIIESAGLNVPDPLTPQSIDTFVDEDIATSKAGHLLVTKSVDLTAFCTPTSGVLYFLIVDDVPIRNSAVFSRSNVTAQLTGVTTGIVDAGPHQIRVGERCTQPGAVVTGGSVTVVGVTSVIVLP